MNERIMIGLKQLVLVVAGSLVIFIPSIAQTPRVFIDDVGPADPSDRFATYNLLNDSPSGKVLSLAAASDGATVYAGTYAGVWRSDNSGFSWHQLIRPQPPLGASEDNAALGGRVVFSVAVSPVNAKVVLAAASRDTHTTPRDGIYVSTDGGDSWPANLAHKPRAQGSRSAKLSFRRITLVWHLLRLAAPSRSGIALLRRGRIY